MAEVLNINERSGVRTWYCPKGHIYRATEPFSAVTTVDGQFANSGPLCAVCYVEWLALMFPTSEAVKGLVNSEHVASKSARLWKKLQDPEYRRAWAEEGMTVGLAFQVRAMRSSRGWSIQDLSERLDIPLTTTQALEDPNYEGWTLDLMRKVAQVFDVGLAVRFVSFSEAVQELTNSEGQRLAPKSWEEEIS